MCVGRTNAPACSGVGYCRGCATALRLVDVRECTCEADRRQDRICRRRAPSKRLTGLHVHALQEEPARAPAANIVRFMLGIDH